MPVLASLPEATGERVQMGKLERLDVVYAERLQGHGPWIFAAPGTGCWRPPHSAHPVIAAISVSARSRGPVRRFRGVELR